MAQVNITIKVQLFNGDKLVQSWSVTPDDPTYLNDGEHFSVNLDVVALEEKQQENGCG